MQIANVGVSASLFDRRDDGSRSNVQGSVSSYGDHMKLFRCQNGHGYQVRSTVFSTFDTYFHP